MKHPVAVEGLEAKNSIFALLVSTAELSNWLIDSFSLLSIEAESAKKDPFHFIFKTSIIFIYPPAFPISSEYLFLIACIHTLTCQSGRRLNATLAEFVVPGLNGHDGFLELSLKPASATN
jgi:hypothetical protein